MAKFTKARRLLHSELKPIEQAVRTIREDRLLLARLHRKLKRDEERHLQTVRQIKLALAALEQPDQQRTATAAKQLNLWSALANGVREDETDKTSTAAKRLARTVARRHEPKERRSLLRLAGLLRGGLARLRSGHDRRAVGMVTVSFDPNSHRDLARVLDAAGIYKNKGRRHSQSTGVDATQAPGMSVKNQTRRGV